MKTAPVRERAGNPADPVVRLPERRLRLSRRTVALSLLLVAVGAALMFTPWRSGPVVGAVCAGLGMAVFFAAGYYWACDNETCS